MKAYSKSYTAVRKSPHFVVKSTKNGFALVLVLWVLSLLTIMAGSFALTMRRESTITAGIKNNAAASAAAEAGIAYAEMMLTITDQNKRWRADGNIYEVDFGGTLVRLRLISETGKIDINKADLKTLQSLMMRSPVDEDLQTKIIGAIMDWRDKDDLLNLDGAEKNEYRKAGLKYQPRNKPFKTVEELQMVLGMDDRLYNWLEPVVTVYSRQPQVNLKLATTNVLNLMPGADAGLIDSFVAARLESDKTGQPLPEFPSNLLTARAGVSPGGETVTIISEAKMPDDMSAIIVATVSQAGGGSQGLLTDPMQAVPFKVLKWQRNPTNEKSLFSEEMTELLVKQYAEPELSH